ERRWRRRREEEMEKEEEEVVSGEKERSKVPHSLAQGFMGLLPAVTPCSESAAP
ncbi:hypothetical protein GBF38_005405, partial [Nibea albiflora]